ncbi:MAG: hypothetical protein OXT65_10115 [Alphaproteobacteria bacterium]|nr:hypothetical protein [Alphaproteobacteria bacterium]
MPTHEKNRPCVSPAQATALLLHELQQAPAQAEACFFLLNAGANVNAVGEWGRSMLELAINGAMDDRSMESKFVAELIAKGADINVRGDNGEALLFYHGALYGDGTKLSVLIDAGMDVNACNKDGVSALAMAINAGCYANAMRLLEKGADMDAPDAVGITPRIAAGYDKSIMDMMAQEDIRRTTAIFQAAADKGTAKPRKIIRPQKSLKAG